MSRAGLRLVVPTTASGDAELIERVANGDIGALGELYDAYAAGLLSFVRRYAPPEDAEDIVQNAFVRVVAAAPSFDRSLGSGKPWLFGIALRVLRERRRSLRRLTAALVALTARPRTPIVETVGARMDVVRALARLTDAKRAVLLLAEVEGFSSQEIAAILEIPVGTVWTRLHHARRELRRCFEEAP